jgi:NADPH-dependent curcumin reductase CurA
MTTAWEAAAMAENRQLVIASLPTGPLEESDFAVQTAPVPGPGTGEVLCRTLALTIGAGQRAGLQGSASYAGAPVVGAVMGGTGLARVEASNADGIAAGATVIAATGWQDYSVHDAKGVTVVDEKMAPADALGVFGTNGLTAYFGLLDVGRPQSGETVMVSAAAGSVGHLVGQIARIQGCHVIGVAGSDSKCALLTNELGFNTALNYKDPDFRAAIKAATPNRVDVYFDNTGGPVLESALFRMSAHGRIVCCGVVSQYDTATPGPGPRGVPGLLVNNRVRMEGFLVFDYRDRFAEARQQLSAWIASGDLHTRATEFDGLDQAPRAFIELLGGGTVGSTIVNVA